MSKLQRLEEKLKPTYENDVFTWFQIKQAIKEVQEYNHSLRNEMKNPNIKTKVVHSKSKPAWNIVGAKLGGKFKIATIPYVSSKSVEVIDATRDEAFEHATFISYCFNHSDAICTG